jgi:hypothetical protein
MYNTGTFTLFLTMMQQIWYHLAFYPTAYSTKSIAYALKHHMQQQLWNTSNNSLYTGTYVHLIIAIGSPAYTDNLRPSKNTLHLGTG